MTAQEERFYREQEYSEAFEEKIKDLKFKHPKSNYDTLYQLAQLLYPRLFSAANGDFSDDFNLKEYAEDEPQFEAAADELAFKAKKYSLEKNVEYEVGQKAILATDPDLAEAYKME